MKQDFKVTKEDLYGIPAFLRVAERRSFSGAAAELGVSPSALSQSIRALKARLGIALFFRTTRSVSLTEAGERFLDMCGLRWMACTTRWKQPEPSANGHRACRA